jgi:hypothetical protein
MHDITCVDAQPLDSVAESLGKILSSGNIRCMHVRTQDQKSGVLPRMCQGTRLPSLTPLCIFDQLDLSVTLVSLRLRKTKRLQFGRRKSRAMWLDFAQLCHLFGYEYINSDRIPRELTNLKRAQEQNRGVDRLPIHRRLYFFVNLGGNGRLIIQFQRAY